MSLCPVKGEEPEREATPPAASVKKQPPAQENAAAVQPVRAAAVEVSAPNISGTSADHLIGLFLHHPRTAPVVPYLTFKTSKSSLPCAILRHSFFPCGGDED